LPLYRDDAFVAHQLGAVRLQNPREKLFKANTVERTVGVKHETGHFVVVFVIDVGKEIRLDLKDGIQIEAVDV
jgi:hypothetical protein